MPSSVLMGHFGLTRLGVREEVARGSSTPNYCPGNDGTMHRGVSRRSCTQLCGHFVGFCCHHEVHLLRQHARRLQVRGLPKRNR